MVSPRAVSGRLGWFTSKGTCVRPVGLEVEMPGV